MTSIRNPPPSTPAPANAEETTSPSVTAKKVETAVPTALEVQNKESFRRVEKQAALGTETAAQTPEPALADADRLTLITQLDALPMGKKGTVDPAPPLAFELPTVALADALGRLSFARETDALAQLLQQSNADSPLHVAASQLEAALRPALTAVTTETTPDAALAAKAAEIALKLDARSPKTLDRPTLRALILEQARAADKVITPAFVIALRQVFGPLPAHLIPFMARLSPTTMHMLGALSKSPSGITESAQLETQASGDSPDAMSDEDLLKLLGAMQPVVLPRHDIAIEPPKNSIDGLYELMLANGSDIETLVEIALSRIKQDAQQDVTEELKRMDLLRLKKERATKMQHALEAAESKAEDAARKRYQERIALPKDDPAFIDSKSMSVDDYLAQQTFNDASHPPLAPPPSDLEIPSDMGFGFGLGPDVPPPPPPAPVTPSDPAAPAPAPGAGNFGLSPAVLTALGDMLKALGITTDLKTYLAAAPPDGLGCVDGQASANRSKIAAWVHTFDKLPHFDGLSSGQVYDAVDFEKDKYNAGPNSHGVTGADAYAADAQTQSKAIADWAASQGVDTSSLDGLLQDFFAAVYRKSRPGGDDPHDAKWFTPVADFLAALPYDQRAKYERYVELRTSEFRRDVDYAEHLSENEASGIPLGYHGAFLDAAHRADSVLPMASDYNDQMDTAGGVLRSYLNPNPFVAACQGEQLFPALGIEIQALALAHPDLLPPELKALLPGGGTLAQRLQILAAVQKKDLLRSAIASDMQTSGMFALNTTLMVLSAASNNTFADLARLTPDELRESRMQRRVFSDVNDARDALESALAAEPQSKPGFKLPFPSSFLHLPKFELKLRLDQLGASPTQQQSSAPAAPLGPLTLSDIKAAINQWKDGVESVSALGEEEQMRMQILMDRLQQCTSILSNLMKKMSDTSQSIIANMK